MVQDGTVSEVCMCLDATTLLSLLSLLGTVPAHLLRGLGVLLGTSRDVI